ncbi:MAG TPA: YggS family pyridoxal phosphate-dependent enzyme [Lacipirellulaceae bacterium]|nr:YggS family pyridoxal phosphate-dependent enzyme [Lacipirellulaceae bacterium]
MVERLIAENVARVRRRIETAARAAGRAPESVRMVAVTKYVDASTAAALLNAGCLELGESRPQQLWAKAASAPLAGARWHLIGRLQRNKVRRTLPLTSLIHSVDSQRLLSAIDDTAAELELQVRVLLEVNCSGEDAKQGFHPAELSRLLPSLSALRSTAVAGLMTMAPLDGGDSAAHRAFATLRTLRDELISATPPPHDLAELSMGMSGDFEAAIAEGATIVRIGSMLYDGLDL